MNNGYSRIRSKSIDFADPSQTAKQLPQEPKSPSKTHSSTQEQEGWEIFGVILERSRSVSSALPSRHKKPEKQRALLLHSGAIKRTFSMRSSSVSGGYYCRIHHQSADCIFEEDDENAANLQRRSVKRRGNILKTCMRLLGL